MLQMIDDISLDAKMRVAPIPELFDEPEVFRADVEAADISDFCRPM